METSEVLLLGYTPPEPKKAVIHLHLSARDASAMMLLLERMVYEKLGNDADITFVLKTEEDRVSGGVAAIENGGIFGYSPRVPRAAFENDTRVLALAMAASSLQSFPVVVEEKLNPSLGIRENKKNWPVEWYGPGVRKGVKVRPPIRSKSANMPRRG